MPRFGPWGEYNSNLGKEQISVAGIKFDYAGAAAYLTKAGAAAAAASMFFVDSSDGNKFKYHDGTTWQVIHDPAWNGTLQKVVEAGASSTNGITIAPASGSALTFTLDNADVGLTINNTGTGNDFTASNWSMTQAGALTATALKLADAKYLNFGTGVGGVADLTMGWNGTNFIIDALAASANAEIRVGYTNHLKFGLYCETTTSYVLFSPADSVKTLAIAGVQTLHGDDAYVKFGNLTTPDAKLGWNTTGSEYLLLLPTVDDTVFQIGNGTLSMDVKVFGASDAAYWVSDASANRIDHVGVSILLGDDTFAHFGDLTNPDVSIEWDTTGTDSLRMTCYVDDTAWEIGNGTKSFAVKIFGNTANNYYLNTPSTDTLSFVAYNVLLDDDSYLKLGTDGDFVAKWINADARLTIEAGTADTLIDIGKTNHWDVKIYAATNTAYVHYNMDDASLLVDLVGINLRIGDDVYLKQGASNDVTQRWVSGGYLETLPAADDTAWKIGNGTLSFDLQWFLSTANHKVLFDADADLVQLGASTYGVALKMWGAGANKYVNWDETNNTLIAACDVIFGTTSSTVASPVAGSYKCVAGVWYQYVQNVSAGTIDGSSGGGYGKLVFWDDTDPALFTVTTSTDANKVCPAGYIIESVADDAYTWMVVRGNATIDVTGVTTIAINDALGSRGTTAGESATTTTANARAARAREAVTAGTPNYIIAMVDCL